MSSISSAMASMAGAGGPAAQPAIEAAPEGEFIKVFDNGDGTFRVESTDGQQTDLQNVEELKAHMDTCFGGGDEGGEMAEMPAPRSPAGGGESLFGR